MKLKSSNGWRRRVVTCRLLAISVAMTLAIVAMSGCSGSRYLSVRKVPKNPLAGPLNLLSRKGPHPTNRTIQTLRRYDLEKLQKESPARR